MKETTVIIDGSMGEGGGQILRTSLALSMLTGKSLKIEKLRSGRSKPGLQRQHLVAVKAAQEISSAEMHGAEIGSSEIHFVPGKPRGGTYKFAIGSAGSATLVLQTVLPALMLAQESSCVTLEGGTHNPWAPPVDYLEKVFLPILHRMGPTVTIDLKRCGFYPAGGGCLHVNIEPVDKLERIDLLERGQIHERKATALLACLPESIGHREIRIVKEKFDMDRLDVSVKQVTSSGPGNVLFVELICDHVTELITSFGKRGISAETVAKDAVKDARRYIASGTPVGPYLADQLLIPMALAGGGSFRTCTPTKHTVTNIDVVKHFLDIAIGIQQVDEQAWHVEIGSKS